MPRTSWARLTQHGPYLHTSFPESRRFYDRSPPRQRRDGLLVQADLALGVLLSLTGLLETGLLALDDAGVTRQVTGLLEDGAVVLDVDLVQ